MIMSVVKKCRVKCHGEREREREREREGDKGGGGDPPWLSYKEEDGYQRDRGMYLVM